MNDVVKLERKWAKENEIRQLKVKLSECLQMQEIYSSRLRLLEGDKK